MDSKDIHTVRKVVMALACNSWEDQVMHLCTATQVCAASWLGVSATKHKAECEQFANDFAEALARFLAAMAEEDVARREPS